MRFASTLNQLKPSRCKSTSIARWRRTQGTTFSGICSMPRIIACRQIRTVLTSSPMKPNAKQIKATFTGQASAALFAIKTFAIAKSYFFAAAIVCLSASAGPIWAQTPDPDDCLSTERILQRYADALGGRAALEGINTRIAEAEALEPSFKPGHPEKRKYVFEWKAPDKVVFKNRTAIFNTFTFKFDGKLLWTTMRGKAVLVGGGGEGNSPFTWMVRIMADPLIFANPTNLYLELKRPRYDFTAAHHYCVLHAVPKANPKGEHILYFDALTGWLRVLEIPYRSGSLFIYFDDYRDVGGVKFPFAITCSVPLGITVRFQKVVHNQPIRDAEFIP
jgi:hypothetical protein